MYNVFFKRFLDAIICLIALPFLALFCAVFAILIKIDDGGCVFYKSKRLGIHGDIFKMLKFRTMKVNAPDIRNADGTTYSHKDDVRLTKIGKLLRSTSIDELPQIFNVLLGHMSLVGPRPDLPDQKELYQDCLEEWEIRVSVRPGITGYSQAYYRNTADFKLRLENDIYYVKRLGFLLDCRIILKTIISVIQKDGIYKNGVNDTTEKGDNK